MRFQVFDSAEEMMAFLDDLRKGAAEALRKADGWKKDLKPGDYFLQILQGSDNLFGETLVIYHRVVPLKELCSEDQESVRDSMKRGYLFCMAYSPICPDGEYGDVHCAMAEFPLSESQFNQAKTQGWPQERDAVRSLLNISDTVGEA